MEWLTCIRTAIDYIEEHLTEDIGAREVAARVYMSPFFLQRGFSVITGYGISEYIRNRRLYLAALDLARTDEKVVDIALRCGYETPESFAKAFARFHGATPSQVRSGLAPIRTFLPLQINIVVHGGVQMDYRLTKMPSFTVIGFQRTFDPEDAYEKIPAFWGEISSRYMAGPAAGNAPGNAYERAVKEHCIGELGICVDDLDDGTFRYLIAGRYRGGEVPDSMTLYEFPAYEWAVFDCYGPNPATLQGVNTKIYSEWLPGNPDFELDGRATVEWYDDGDFTAKDYHCAIWLPVKRKKRAEGEA